MRITLASIRKAAAHPLAREVHFHVILLALRILAYCTGSSEKLRWQLKDQILTVGLAWFSHPPRWSFGSNKLQIKAEVQLMTDVLSALQYTTVIGAKHLMPLLSLQPKQELLSHLITSETSRLGVWITPLTEASSGSYGSHFGLGKSAVSDNSLSPFIRTAWKESASLAIQLALRSHSPRVQAEVRSLLVKYPERALDEPEALQLLLGNTLPADVSTQLKVSTPCNNSFFMLLITSSIFCTGLLSTRYQLRRTSCQPTATTRSSSSMLCARWRATRSM